MAYIEQPFAFPDETARAIRTASLSISGSPEPDMILTRDADKKALYFEAKAGSFSPSSANAKQARGHLLACGSAFAQTVAPLKKALLCYVLPEAHRGLMAECLATLATELQSAGFAPGEHSVHGLTVVGSELIYSFDSAFKEHCCFAEDSAPVLHELQHDTDPSPLLLVFTEEDCPDQERFGYYRRVLVNQVVARLVCDLNLLPPEQTYVTAPRDLLLRTTDGVLNFVGRERQKSMVRIVRHSVFGRISSAWRGKPFSPVRLEGERLEIRFKDNLAKAEFMEWLEDPRRAAFSDQRPPPEAPCLPGLDSS